jgi:predicted GNAT family N-acyltransferase
MIHIRSFTIEDNLEYQQALQIRRTIFIDEQKVPVELEIENEEQAKYYLIFDEGKPIGTGRWRRTKEGIKLERFAILPARRNKGTGSILLKHVLDDLKEESSTIYLHSQLPALNYYLKHGFVTVGEVFVEAGIEHYKMILSR